jgi:hypothetical protein
VAPLEALGGVRGRQRDPLGVVLGLAGEQPRASQERRKPGRLPRRLVGARRPHEVAQALEPGRRPRIGGRLEVARQAGGDERLGDQRPKPPPGLPDGEGAEGDTELTGRSGLASSQPGSVAGAEQCVEEVQALGVGVRDEAGDGGGAEAAPGGLQGAGERDAVAGVGQQREVGERVADLGVLEEPLPAQHPVRHLGDEQRLLHRPRLVARPEEHRDLVGRRPAVEQRPAPASRRPGLLPRIRVALHPDVRACGLEREHPLGPPLAVVGDEPPRRAHDGAGGAEVALQALDAGAREQLLKAQHVRGSAARNP